MLPHLKKTATKCTQGNIFAQKKNRIALWNKTHKYDKMNLSVAYNFQTKHNALKSKKRNTYFWHNEHLLVWKVAI